MKAKKIIAGICAFALAASGMNGVTLYAKEPEGDSRSRVFFDDRSPNIQYTGKMTINKYTEERMLYNTGTWSSGNQGNSTAAMTFFGTGIELMANEYKDNATSEGVTVSIDGGAPETLALNRKPADAYGLKVWEKTDLAYGKHTIFIDVPNKKFEFDGFYVLDTTETADGTELMKFLEGASSITEEEYTSKSYASYKEKYDRMRAISQTPGAVWEEWETAKAEFSQAEQNLIRYSYTEKLPHSQMTATANSEMNPPKGNDGPAAWAIDGILTHWWHSNWDDKSGVASPGNPIYITLDLGGSYFVDSYIYHARTDKTDYSTSPKDYTLSVANMPGGEEPQTADFKLVKSGILPAVQTPQKLTLDQPEQATHIRLTATSAYGNYVSASNLEVEVNVLSEPSTDTAPLTALLDEAKAKAAEDYTAESFKTLTDAIAAADNFLTGRYVQSEVNEQKVQLEAAVSGLAEVSHNADLASLTYTLEASGTAEEIVLTEGQTEYEVELPFGTAGEISFTALAEDASAVVTADPVTIDNKTATAVITVLAGDGTTEKTYTVQFTVKEKEFMVTVINGEEEAAVQEYNHSEVVRLTAKDVPGKQFAYWMYNGEIVSYNVNHFFVVVENATIEARYAMEPEEQLPQILMPKEAAKIQPKGTTNNLIYYGQMVLPKGYTAVECGMLFINQAINEQNLHDFVKGGTVNNVGVVSKLAKSTNSVGQYAFTITGVKTKQTRAGRMFLTYRNTATGDEVTIYSQNAVTLITN